jgi:hypothetical protein
VNGKKSEDKTVSDVTETVKDASLEDKKEVEAAA